MQQRKARASATVVILVAAFVMALSGASSARAAAFAWSAPVKIDPGHDLYGGVSCPSESFCVAADDAGNVLTTTDPAVTWTAANIAGATADIACPSVTLCIAVDQTGHVISSSNPTGGAAAWHSVFVDEGPVHLGEDFSAISCPSVSFCVAADTSGHVFTATEPTGPASAWQMAKISGAGSIGGLSCPTASFCAATDDDSNVLTSANPAGGAAAWNLTHLPGLAFPASLRDIACASASLCVTGDEGGENVSAQSVRWVAPAPGASRPGDSAW